MYTPPHPLLHLPPPPLPSLEMAGGSKHVTLFKAETAVVVAFNGLPPSVDLTWQVMQRLHQLCTYLLKPSYNLPHKIGNHSPYSSEGEGSDSDCPVGIAGTIHRMCRQQSATSDILLGGIPHPHG